MPKGILEQLADSIVIGDGGYIVELERRGYVIAVPFTPELSPILTRFEKCTAGSCPRAQRFCK